MYKLYKLLLKILQATVVLQLGFFIILSSSRSLQGC